MQICFNTELNNVKKPSKLGVDTKGSANMDRASIWTHPCYISTKLTFRAGTQASRQTRNLKSRTELGSGHAAWCSKRPHFEILQNAYLYTFVL